MRKTAAVIYWRASTLSAHVMWAVGRTWGRTLRLVAEYWCLNLSPTLLSSTSDIAPSNWLSLMNRWTVELLFPFCATSLWRGCLIPSDVKVSAPSQPFRAEGTFQKGGKMSLKYKMNSSCLWLKAWVAYFIHRQVTFMSTSTINISLITSGCLSTTYVLWMFTEIVGQCFNERLRPLFLLL